MRKTAIARAECGYAMVALLILMAVMAVAMTVALPAWSTLTRREKEAELVFRGEQYARAIVLFQRKYAGTFPPTVDVLVTERFLRKKFKDPITNEDFKTIAVGEAVGTAQTTNPLSPSATGARAGTPQTGGRAGFTLGGTGQGAQPGSSTFTVSGVTGARGGMTGDARASAGVAGVSAGIMGVTSKSTDESIRQYKGADHYNQWLFIATQASIQAGGRGARTAGEGVRGGPPPAPGRQGGPGRGTPFGGTPFGRGQQPAPPPPPAPPGRGRF